jgi:Putative beta-barrel porin 2
MLLRSRGWLCTATICQALAHTAHGQTAAPSPSPSPVPPASESDSWKVEAPAVEQEPQLNEPNTNTDTGSEQQPGWTGGLLEPGPESKPQEQAPLVPENPRGKGLGLLLGFIDVRPKMDFAVTYDDNILISSSNQKKDFVYTLSPGALLGIGDYLQKESNYIRFEYVPTLTLFQHFSGFDFLEHYVRFESQYTFSRLQLRNYFEYDKLSGPNRDIGGRVNSDQYAAGLEATYAISDKTSLDVDAGLNILHYQSQIGSKEFLNHNWVNYNLTPKLNIGVGAAFGVLNPDKGVTQPYQQALFRVRFTSTAKLTFNGNAGVEFRQFASEGGTRVTPVFGLSANYDVFPGTRLSLSGARTVTNSSSINGDDYTATRLGVGLNQHVIGRLSFNLEGGYENDAYRQTTAGAVGPQREDNYLFIRPSLTYHLQDWADVTLSYFYRNNDSNFPTKAFTNNQVSAEVRFGF